MKKLVILFTILLLSITYGQTKITKDVAFNADSVSVGKKITTNTVVGGLFVQQGTCTKVYLDVSMSLTGSWYQLQKDGAAYYEEVDSTNATAVSFEPILTKDWAYFRFRLDADPSDTVNTYYVERVLR